MKLTVNDTELQLNPNEVVAISLQADSLEAVKEIQSSYSSEFNIPLSVPNRQILGNVQAGDSQGSEYEALNCNLYDEDNTPIVIGGKLLIEQINKRTARCNVIQGNVQLLDVIGDKTLQQLSVSSLGAAVSRTEANIVANIDNVFSDGYTYGTFNNGNYTFGDAYSVKGLYPMPYVWKIMQSIVNQAGFSLDTTQGLMTDSKFRRTVLMYSGSRYNEKQYFFEDVSTFQTTGGSTSPGVYQKISANTSKDNEAVLISNNNFSQFYGLKITDASRAIVFQGKALIDILPLAGSYQFNLRIRNITQGITYASFNSGLVTGVVDRPLIDVTLTTNLIANFQEGDFIQFQIDAVTGLEFNFVAPSYFRTDDGREDVGISVTNLYQDPIAPKVFDPLTLLPDMPIRDFIKDILQMFCARLDTDPLTGNVVIRMFKDYATDLANAKDFSSKIDYSEDIEQEYKYGNYGRTTRFTYDNEDGLPERFGSGEILISNDQLQDSANLIELGFSGSSYSESNLNVPICEAGSDDIVNELTQRIAVTSSITGGDIDVGTTNVTTCNSFLFRPLAWVATEDADTPNPSAIGLLQGYWQEFRLTIQAMNKTTLTLLFNATDWAELSLFQLVYIQWSDTFTTINGYFLIQLIDEYRGDGKVKVELIKVNQI